MMDPAPKERFEITSLPKELLCMITEYLPQGDVASMTRSCQVLNDAAIQTLYRDVTIITYKGAYCSDVARLQRFIHTLLQYPERGASIHHAELRLHIEDSLSTEPPLELYSCKIRIRNEKQRLLAYIQESGLDHSWIRQWCDGLKWDFSDAMQALALCLLPNLQSLRLYLIPGDTEMLARLFAHLMSPRKSRIVPGWTELKDLQLRTPLRSAWVYQYCDAIPFSLLPALRSINSNFVYPTTGQATVYQHLTSLTFKGSPAPDRQSFFNNWLHDMLKECPKLQTLAVENIRDDCFSVGLTAQLEPYLASLQHLTITRNTTWDIFQEHMGIVRQYLSYVKLPCTSRCHGLKSLTVDAFFFFNRERDLGWVEDEDGEDGKTTMPRLLPSTIETLYLRDITKSDLSSFCKYLKAVAQAKEKGLLPNLCQIIYTFIERWTLSEESPEWIYIRSKQEQNIFTHPRAVSEALEKTGVKVEFSEGSEYRMEGRF